jgi:proton-translocating NADH-quinone oxidoreductase chain M
MSYLLSVLLIIPAFGFLLTWALGSDQRTARGVALLFSLAELTVVSLILVSFWIPLDGWLGPRLAGQAGAAVPFSYLERSAWIPQLGMGYVLGVDELSVPLLWLTALLTTLAIVFHWDEEHRPREFYALLLFLEMSLTGVFMALDFFLFLIFWELVLIPMFILIGIWGGPNRRYASLKFLVYTHVGYVIMLLSVFYLYWTFSAEANLIAYGQNVRTFDMTAFFEAAHQRGIPYLSLAAQIPAFIGFLFAFLVKLPSVPFHTWLPDAHVEAPTGGSVILAGVLLKMGGYGLFRINVQILPQAASDLYWVLLIFGTVSILYAAVVCLAQDDLKRLVAYSSVSHMGFVTLGIAAGVYGTAHGNAAIAALGFAGAIFMMFAHGLISPAMFMVAGAMGHRIGTRNISELGGLAQKTPLTATFMMISFMASLGLPGLVGFVAEFAVFLGVYAAFGLFLFVPILTVVLTAAYMIWAMQRSIFGPLNPRWDKAQDLQRFESLPLGVLSATFALFGIVPILIYELIVPWASNALAALI